MSESKYWAEYALADLKSAGVLSDYRRHGHYGSRGRAKQYWSIKWNGEADFIETAVGATQGTKGSSNVSFGIQEQLLDHKAVDEIILVVKRWEVFYRIPAAVAREWPLTVYMDGRKLIYLDFDDCVVVKGRKLRIKEYKREINPVVEVKVRMKAQELAALRKATKSQNDADAIANAAREFLRLNVPPEY